MRKIIFTLVVLLIGAALIAQGTFRTERIYGESIGRGIEVVYYHDKESGVEVMCFYDTLVNGFGATVIQSLSCVPTGRNWKK